MAAAAAAHRPVAPSPCALLERRQLTLKRGAAPSRTLAAAQVFELEAGAVAVAPSRRRPRGLVHFVGGAFVGAAPVPAYSLLLELLAEGGYTVIATPYAVTFRHLECARAVHAAFDAALRQLRAQQGSWAAPTGLPVHGVGHSNGSLLHLLIGSGVLQEAAAAAAAAGASAGGGNGAGAPHGHEAPDVPRVSNVLMSYNNFQVGKAVPVPLSLLAPGVQQMRGGGRLADSAAAALQQAGAAAAQLADAAGPLAGQAGAWLPPPEQVLRELRQLDPALVQLGSVFDEVGDGFEDFTPSPQEARQLIASAYAVPDTLLIQFTDDNTDETPEAAAMLSAPPATPTGEGAPPQRQVSTLVLPGSHVTPCGPAPAWRLPAGSPFGPAEVVGMAAQAVLQRDTYRLASEVLAHLDARS